MIKVMALAFVLAIGACASMALAQQATGNGIEVVHAWARATPGRTQTGAAYASIVNHGGAPDRLIAVSSPVAEKADLHEDKLDNGIMKMRPLDALTIAPGHSTELKPGGDHIMLMGLKQPLRQGESFPMVLTFEKAGAVKVMVNVEKPGAMGAPSMDHMHSSAPGK